MPVAMRPEGSRRGREVYRSSSQARGFVGILIVVGLMWARLIVGSTGGPDAVAGMIICGITVVVFARAAAAALMIDVDHVRIRNVCRTTALQSAEIAAVRVGRYGLLGSVLLLELCNGQRVPVFAIQGITGQPRRKSSVDAQRIAIALNERFSSPEPRGS